MALHKRKIAGFTLIEVLIAILVFAAAGTLITARVGDTSTQLFSLERKTIAHWVAENHLAKQYLSRRTNDTPLKKEKNRVRATMGGRQWRVHSEVSDTSHPWLRRIDIEVFEIEEGIEIGPIDSVFGYIGRY